MKIMSKETKELNKKLVSLLNEKVEEHFTEPKQKEPEFYYINWKDKCELGIVIGSDECQDCKHCYIDNNVTCVECYLNTKTKTKGGN